MILFQCARFDQLVLGEYGDFSGSGDSGEPSESIASLSILVNVAYSGESGALHKSGDIFPCLFFQVNYSPMSLSVYCFLCLLSGFGLN